jgi:hypothetical protein
VLTLVVIFECKIMSVSGVAKGVNNDSHPFCLPIKGLVFPIYRILTPVKMLIVVESTFELEFTRIYSSSKSSKTKTLCYFAVAFVCTKLILLYVLYVIVK